MVFPPNWYDYKVSYAHPFGSIAAVLLTCAFLYASLAKNERISKGRYVLCGGIALIFPVLAALYFSNETAYLCFGILVILFLLSILEYGYCSRRNEEQPCSLLALLLALAQLAAAWLPAFLPHILQRHLGLQIDRFFPERAVFYLSTALGILLLFASYLPRRDILRWMDRAAVVVSAAAFAAVVCGLVLSFQNRLSGGLLVMLDLTVCLLTAAAYVLLLLAGKKPARNLSEPPADTETDRSSPNETESV